MTSNQEEQINENVNIDNNNSQNNNPENNIPLNISSNQPGPQNNNLYKSHQLRSKDIPLNKLNTNSSINIPPGNVVTNMSLNEQILHQQKDHNDYFDNEVSYQDEEDNDPILKDYTMINNRRNNIIDNIKNINERLKNNILKIEEIKQNLINLKEEKNQKQIDIVNLLSNKESIEEIYKNQIYSINTQHSVNNSKNNLNDNSDMNNLVNISIKNEINDNSSIHLNSNHNITLDNTILNNDEDNFKITLNEIKESDQKKYIEQVISLFEDLFKKRDDKINSSISDKIKDSYKLFLNNNIEENDNENNNDIIVTNFFGKVSIYISNYSLGKYSESKINLLLRYLLKINAINVKLTKYIKFVNKKYKEKKRELNDMINFLEKKNLTLSEKKNKLEENMKECTDRLEFFGKNDVFAIEQRFENIDDILDNVNNETQKNYRNKNISRLGHDVVIEYEDGIDQNVEINYEEDDLANEYDYEKENEMINQGLNPYNYEKNQFNKYNIKKNSVINKQRILKNNRRQIIVNDNDEADKYLKEFLQKKDTNSNIPKKNKATKSIGEEYLIIGDDDNKDFIDITDENIFEENLTNKNLSKNNNNISSDTNNSKKYSYQTQNVKRINDSYNLVKKNVYSIKTTIPSNIISDNRIYLSNNPNAKTQKDLEKLSAIELSHYKRVQRIMNSGPKVNNIFGVNNYNPENCTNSINIDNNMIISPKKRESNFATTNNKIDKTIRIGSRQNHNFISIINMTKNAPVKKRNGREKDRTKIKEKRRGSKGNNEGIIQIINLEDNFLKELKDDEKNENENEKSNKTGNESTSNITNNNNNSKRNNSNDKIENEENSNNNNNNKNEVQGYYLNILNNKEQSKENENKENKEINENENKTKNENNELFTNSNKKTMKITKSRELNINDIKNLNVNKKITSKGNVPKNNGGKIKTKLLYLNNIDNKDEFQINNNTAKLKANNSLNKIVNHKKTSTTINSCFNINDSSNNNKRSHSVSENNQTKEEVIKKKYNTKFIITNNDNSNNKVNNTSPNVQRHKKISNIPISKIKKTNLNLNSFEGNVKKEIK